MGRSTSGSGLSPRKSKDSYPMSLEMVPVLTWPKMANTAWMRIRVALDDWAESILRDVRITHSAACKLSGLSSSSTAHHAHSTGSFGNMFSNNRSRSAPKSTQSVSLVGPTQIVTTSHLEVVRILFGFSGCGHVLVVTSQIARHWALLGGWIRTVLDL